MALSKCNCDAQSESCSLKLVHWTGRLWPKLPLHMHIHHCESQHCMGRAEMAACSLTAATLRLQWCDASVFPALHRDAERVASYRLHAAALFCFDAQSAWPLYRLPPPVVLQQLFLGPWRQHFAWPHDQEPSALCSCPTESCPKTPKEGMVRGPIPHLAGWSSSPEQCNTAMAQYVHLRANTRLHVHLDLTPGMPVQALPQQYRILDCSVAAGDDPGKVTMMEMNYAAVLFERAV